MIVFTILGVIALVAGVVGCTLPILPGPPLTYLSLILVSIARAWEAFSPAFLIIMGGITIVVTVLDYILPAAVSRKRGATKVGTFGSIIGMMVGMAVKLGLSGVIGFFFARAALA